MAEFKYKAKDSRGKVKTGVISAASKKQAKDQLTRMRLKSVVLTASKLDDVDEPKSFFEKIFVKDSKGRVQIQIGSGPKLTTKDLIVFTKQFATMINSGVALIQALHILGSQQRVPSFGKALRSISAAVENGAKLSDALEAYPKIFDTLYCALVRAGEASGNLDTILIKLTTYIEKAAKIKSQVKSAMMYPLIVVVVAGTVVAGLLIFVVPTFAKQYTDEGKPLPEITQVVVDASNFLVDSWYMILGAMIGASFLFRFWVRTEKGRAIFDQYILKAPGIGELLRKIAVGRFCSTMSTMLTSGVNILDALTICAASSGNKTIEKFVLNVRSKIEQGTKFSEPLAEGDLFPNMVVSMVAVGEQTGAMDEMLIKVSDFYEEEVDLAVETVLSMIEPIMIVTIGGIVGFIVIAMYMPVFDMATLVGG
jgi:type IV pilus assembly protein PilC